MARYHHFSYLAANCTDTAVAGSGLDWKGVCRDSNSESAPRLGWFSAHWKDERSTQTIFYYLEFEFSDLEDNRTRSDQFYTNKSICSLTIRERKTVTKTRTLGWDLIRPGYGPLITATLGTTEHAPNMHVFGLWEEAGVSGGNPREHGGEHA